MNGVVNVAGGTKKENIQSECDVSKTTNQRKNVDLTPAVSILPMNSKDQKSKGNSGEGPRLLSPTSAMDVDLTQAVNILPMNSKVQGFRDDSGEGPRLPSPRLTMNSCQFSTQESVDVNPARLVRPMEGHGSIPLNCQATESSPQQPRPHVTPDFGSAALLRPPEVHSSSPCSPSEHTEGALNLAPCSCAAAQPRPLQGHTSCLNNFEKEAKVITSSQYRNIHEITCCKELAELGDDQKQMCSFLHPDVTDMPDVEKEGVSSSKQRGKGRSNEKQEKKKLAEGVKMNRSKSALLRFSSAGGEKDPLVIEQLEEGEARAWTVGRDVCSRSIFSVLIDTGNGAVSCIPYHLYTKLCKDADTNQLDPYLAPVVGVGSKRVQVHGRLRRPLHIFLEGCDREIAIRPIVITSKQSHHLNLGMKDLSMLGVSLSLSQEGNWLEVNQQWIQLHSKADASRAAQSNDPALQMAFLNHQHKQAVRYCP